MCVCGEGGINCRAAEGTILYPSVHNTNCCCESRLGQVTRPNLSPASASAQPQPWPSLGLVSASALAQPRPSLSLSLGPALAQPQPQPQPSLSPVSASAQRAVMTPSSLKHRSSSRALRNAAWLFLEVFHMLSSFHQTIIRCFISALIINCWGWKEITIWLMRTFSELDALGPYCFHQWLLAC